MSASVYIVRNVMNDHIYVGKSIDPAKRWQRHLKDAQNGSNVALHNAIRKWGRENFFIIVAETYPTEDEAYVAEATLYEKLRNEGYTLYNETTGGKGAYKLTESNRRKISERVKEGLSKVDMSKVYNDPEYRKNLSESVKKSYTKELIEKRRQQVTQQWKNDREGLRERMFSPEARKKRSIAHVGIKWNRTIVHPNDLDRLIYDLQQVANIRIPAMCWGISYHAAKCILAGDYRWFVMPTDKIEQLHRDGVSVHEISQRLFSGKYVKHIKRLLDGEIKLSSKSSVQSSTSSTQH